MRIVSHKGAFLRRREKPHLHRSMLEFVSHIPVQHRRLRASTETALYKLYKAVMGIRQRHQRTMRGAAL